VPAGWLVVAWAAFVLAGLAGLAAVAVSAGLALVPARTALIAVLALAASVAAALCAAVVREARRRIAAEAERQRASMQSATLLAAQHQFLQDASHQLRTPITIGLGHAELLQRLLAGQAEAGYIQVVVEELYRLRRLAERLLVIAASEDPEFLNPEPVALGEFITGMIRQWRPAAPRSWRAGPAEEVTVQADRERLRLAVEGLIENAVRHTRERDAIEMSVVRAGPGARIVIRDTGSGITPYDLPRIFDRFRTGAGSAGAGGTGLGLALVRAIARAHGGDVEVASTPGVGSEFTLVLPVQPQEPVQPLAAGQSGQQATPARGARLMTGRG
jgi:signal transduction histidine kinase